jgi:hypothetical protein
MCFTDLHFTDLHFADRMQPRNASAATGYFVLSRT